MKRNRNHRDRARSTGTSFFEPLERRQLMSSGGELDISFSDNGKTLVTDTVGVTLTATDLAVQADGKTVVTGYARAATNGNQTFFTVRFNANGTLDKAFGPRKDGKVFTSIGGRFAQANALAIQPDGKIVIVGSRDVNYHSEFAVVRYNADGSLDTTFDGDGKRTFRVKDSSNAYAVAIQRDGKIIVAGSDYNGNGVTSAANSDFAAVRLNPNGSFDPTFGFFGKTRVAMGDEEYAHAVTIDYTGTAATNPNFGKIILAGSHYAYGRSFMALARLNANGRIDGTFDRVAGLPDTGYNIDPFPGRKHAQLTSVLVQPDGKIVVAGHAGDDSGGSNQFALARYTANGKLDKSFGPSASGFVETGFGGKDLAFDVVRAPDGGLVVGGAVNGKLSLAAYDASGNPHRDFGSGGKLNLNLGESGGYGGLAITNDNRLVIAGGKAFATARLFLSKPTVGIHSHYQKASEAGLQKGSVIITRDSARLPLRVYLNVGGSATLNGDYTTNLTIFEPPSSGKTKLAGSKIGKIIGGGVKNVIGGGGVIGGLPTIVGNRSLPFIDLAAGQTSATVNVNVIQDSRLEPVETAIFTLAADSEYSLGSKKAATVFIDDDDDVRINFQAPSTSSPGGGYTADVGAAFADRGNGLTFGWDADNTANARTQNDPGSPDFRYDTYNHMQKNSANRRWEIAVPNGLYQVRLVAGDPKHTDSLFRMNLENTLALSGTPANDVRWFRRTINVQVTDGRLTLSNASGAMNNKIAFIDIQSAPIGAAAGQVTGNLPVRLVTASTQSNWTPKPNDLFADKQIDEPLWA